jgi:acetyl esterase/lipase
VAFTLDPQVASAMGELSALAAGASKPDVGDVASRRVWMEAGQEFMESKRVTPSDVTMTDFEAGADDHATIGLRWYARDGSSPGSAVVHLYGGGMILSNVGLYDGIVAPLRFGERRTDALGGVSLRTGASGPHAGA